MTIANAQTSGCMQHLVYRNEERYMIEDQYMIINVK